jgi:hypothetical protein
MDAGGQGLRQIGEEIEHFAAAFQMPFAVRAEDPTGSIQMGVLPDAGEDVEETFVLGSGMADAVRGDDRQTEAVCHLQKCLVARLFVPLPMPLELDVEVLWKDLREVLEQLLGGATAIPVEGLGQGSLFTAGQTVKTLGVGGDEVPVCQCFSLRSVSCRCGQQLAEVPVAGAAGDEQGETRGRRAWGLGPSIPHPGLRVLLLKPPSPQALESWGVGGGYRHLRSHQGFDARLSSCLIEARCAIDPIAIDKGHGRQFQLRRTTNEIFG